MITSPRLRAGLCPLCSQPLGWVAGDKARLEAGRVGVGGGGAEEGSKAWEDSTVCEFTCPNEPFHAPNLNLLSSASFYSHLF